MLDHLTRNFRELLKQFDGVFCPLCAVLKRREPQEVERLYGKARSAPPLCARHLATVLTTNVERAKRARTCRDALKACLAGHSECGVCVRLGQMESLLAHAIRRLDGSMRFNKAIEAAPLFCKKHVTNIVSEHCAPNFAQVQRAKTLQLRDALAQAELRNSEDLEWLISRVVAYLTPPVEQDPPPKVEDSRDSVEKEAFEFERWEEARLVKHLSALESEVASLRYRNAVLSEANRRLNLAHTAGEVIRRDLERDRRQLLAAVGQQNSLKDSNQR